MSSVIQFTHPGKEWEADRTARHSRHFVPAVNAPGWFHRSWTVLDDPAKSGTGIRHGNGHGRKFVEGSGRYVQNIGGEEILANPLYFWCEAEWGTMTRHLAMPANAMTTSVYPQWLHKFYSRLPVRPPDGVNTDPYIFGKQFIYSNCRQNTSLHNTQIFPGDLILFGSLKRNFNTPRFMLDTVFVVGEHSCPIKGKTIAEIREECGEWISDSFAKTVLEQLKGHGCCGHHDEEKDGASCGDGSFTLYFGASYEDPWKKTFSFVPVKIPGLDQTTQQEDYGYERLTFTTLPASLSNVLNLNLAQGVRIRQADSVKVWEEIVEFAFQQGYRLGTFFKEP